MKKRRLNRIGYLLVALVIVLIAAFGIRLFERNRNVEPEVVVVGETPEPTPEMEEGYITYNIELDSAGDLSVQHVHVNWDADNRPGEVREIRFLVIHETDNRSSGADAAAHSSYLTGDSSGSTGWHYTVDDHSIYHNLPDNEIAWNAGDQRTVGGGNMNGIGIEMCVNVGGDYDQTIENTAILCAHLLRQYNLDADAVYLHQDFMNKECPHRMISEGKVEYFMEQVRVAYEALGQIGEETHE